MSLWRPIVCRAGREFQSPSEPPQLLPIPPLPANNNNKTQLGVKHFDHYVRPNSAGASLANSKSLYLIPFYFDIWQRCIGYNLLNFPIENHLSGVLNDLMKFYARFEMLRLNLAPVAQLPDFNISLRLFGNAKNVQVLSKLVEPSVCELFIVKCDTGRSIINEDHEF